MILPRHIAQKVAMLPVTAQGEREVTLILRDARLVTHVTVASAALVRVGSKPVMKADDLDFSVNDVVDVCNA